ncbi:MAG: DNA-binding protein [Nanoarchaeota archaeon]|nr:DNA-binding protein [Nanoarchaeota archaeon]
MRVHVLQLKPGQDLKEELSRFVKSNRMCAGYILTGVGNLRKATLRFVDEDIKTFNEHFGILSLDGTLSSDGMHIHIVISDKEGKAIGGHLKEGCIVYHSAEIVIGESENLRFSREFDKRTNFKELRVKKIKKGL